MDKVVWFFEKLFFVIMIPVIAVLVLGYAGGKSEKGGSNLYGLYFLVAIANAVFVWYLIYRVWWM